MKFRLFPLFIGVVVAGSVSGIAILEIEKAQLRRRTAPLSQSATRLVHLRAESARNQAILDRFKTSSEEGGKELHGDLVAAREELAALEAKAARSSAGASATPSIDANRDPTKAMTRLEFLSEAGRATPEAAFQTLIWAAMKGRDPEMAACLALDPAARAKAESLLGTLPAEARASYGTPEQLVGLVLAQGVLDSTALQFVRRPVDDGDHVTLAVLIRANGRESETKIPMVSSSEGWRMNISEKQIDVIRSRLAGAAPKP